MSRYSSTIRFAVLLLVVFSLSGCDLSWEEDAHASYKQSALEVTDKDNPTQVEKALSLLSKALERNPYHPAANYDLAQLYNERLFDEALALTYYQRYLSLNQGDAQAQAEQQAQLMRKIMAGDLEDPIAAFDDFLWALQQKNQTFFEQRLSADLRTEIEEEFDRNWEDAISTWSKRVADRTHRISARKISGRRSNLKALLRVVFQHNGKEEWVDVQLELNRNAPLWKIQGLRRVREH